MDVRQDKGLVRANRIKLPPALNCLLSDSHFAAYLISSPNFPKKAQSF